MAYERKGYDVYVTPLGELEYPWVTKPDTRYDPEGVYQSKMIVPFDDTGAQELIATLTKARDDFFQTLDTTKQKTYRKADVYEDEMDDDGEPTGNVKFKFKLKAVVTPKDKGKEPFVQAPELSYKHDSDMDKPVYGGTMAKVKGHIVPYTNAAQKVAGITLRLKGVEVHELVTAEKGNFWSDFS